MKPPQAGRFLDFCNYLLELSIGKNSKKSSQSFHTTYPIVEEYAPMDQTDDSALVPASPSFERAARRNPAP